MLHFGFPMQHVGLDLFSFGGKDYLICVHQWSGYPVYQLLRSTTSDSVIRCLSSWFNLLGWPSSIRSDGGPQFRGNFSAFCTKHGVQHEVSAPYNPNSNGLAEAGIKSVKNMLKKCVSLGADSDFMLYEWRNIPCADGYSPSQLMFGRSQRTCLPSFTRQNPPIDFIKAAASKDSAHSRSEADHDRSKHSLSQLSPGQQVHLQDCTGVIVSMRPDKLSYMINVDNRFFTHPRLLHPVVPNYSDPPTSISPTRISPPLLRCSERLQSRVNSSAVQTSIFPLSSTCSKPPKTSLTASPQKSVSKNGSEPQLSLLQHRTLPSSSKTRPTSLSAMRSTRNPTCRPQPIQPWIQFC